MYAGVIQELIEQLERLPGIGPKGSQRIAFYLLEENAGVTGDLAKVLTTLKSKINYCPQCWNITEGGGLCPICSNPRRDRTMLCVVEGPKDVMAIEKTAEYRGLYHVLGGCLSPIDGIGPDHLRIRELASRLSNGEVEELILATNPNLEGEATASFLARLFGELEGLAVTRLASGLPVGGDLEFADEVTLGRALEGRRRLNSGPG
jgi:recombination protein RecR